MIVGLGSNLGSREALLRAAIDGLDGLDGVAVRARSRLYVTAPVGPPQPDYLNAAVSLEVADAPTALLRRTLALEAALGRVRAERWGPRTLDLDLLWAERPVRTDALTVPHPRLRERAFALAPLLDVAPDLAARFGPALEAAGGAPPTRACTEARAVGDGWTVEALDDADALALAVTARAKRAAPQGAPEGRWAPVEAPDAGTFARVSAAPCVVFSSASGAIRGAARRPWPAVSPPAAVELHCGRCRLRGDPTA